MAAALPALRDDTSKRPGVGAGQFVVALLALSVICGALGAVFALKTPLPAPTDGAKVAATAHKTPLADVSRASSLLDLPPVVTNLGAPSDTWVRLESSMIFDPKDVPHPEALAGQIAGDLLAYLRTSTLTQIQGPIGLQNLREDLNERASIRSGGKVKELIIRTLVVQ